MHFVADLRVVLRGRDFRHLFAVRLVSQSADGAFQVALASLVFFSPERAATAQAAAAAAAVTVLPYTVIGPFAGVLLDHWRRRQVLLVANLVRTGLVRADRGAGGRRLGRAGAVRRWCSPACRSTGSSSPRSGPGCRTWCRATSW